jgi:tetratricopeptide (TPR) repeat protein
MLALKSHFVTMSRNWDQVQRVRMGLMRLVPSLCLLLSFVATCRADSKAHAEALVGKQVVPKCPYIGFRVGKETVDINHWRMPIFRVEEVKGNELRLSCEARKGEEAWVAIDDVVELDDALVLYSLNIEAFADDLNSRKMRSLVWAALKDFKNAENEFTTLIETNPEDSNSLLARGATRISLGQFDRSIADFNAALHLDPEFAAAYLLRGRARTELNQLDRAFPDLDQAIRLDPDLPQAYYFRGRAWSRKGNQERAIIDFTEAIRREPSLAKIYWCRAYEFYLKKEYDRAIADYNEAIRIEPNLPQVNYSRGRVWASKGDHDRAIADYNEAIQRTPNAAYLYHSRGYELIEKKEYGRAIADLDEAIRLAPKNPDVWVERGRAWIKKGNAEKGLEDVAKALLLDPSNARGHTWLIYGMKWRVRHELDASRCDEAMVDLNELIRLAPNDFEVYGYRSEARMHKHDRTGAISDILKAIELNPKNPRLHVWLAKMRLDHSDPNSDDYLKAVEEMRIACKLTDEKDPQTVENLACALYRAGQNEQALEWQKKAIVLWPDGPLKKAAIDRLKYYEEKIKTADFDPKFGEALLEQLDKEAADPTPPKPSTTPGTWLGKRVVPKSQLIGFRVSNEIVGINHWPIPIFQVKEVKGGRLRLSCERMKGGEAWVAIGDVVGLDDAIAYFSISIAAFEWDIFPRAMRGLVWARLCEYRKAERDFTAAIELDPEDTNVLQGRGFARLALKEYDRAIADFNAVLNLNPENAPAYAMRGMARLEKKQFDRAIRDFDQALALEPEMPMIGHSREFAREASRKAASVDFDVQLVEGLEELLDRRSK